MSLPKINDIRHLNNDEIEQRTIELKIEILNLKIKQITQQDIKTHLFKHKKRELAQLLTYKQQQI